MKRFLLPLFLIIASAQIAAPVYLILLYEDTLKNGIPVRLKTRPFDPTDVFRGKYVRLDFDNPIVEEQKNINPRKVKEAWVLLKNGKDGFAVVDRIALEPSDKGAWLKVDIAEDFDSTLRITYPFDRFYMDEGKAPRAEEVYQDSLRNGKNMTWADIRILHGRGVIAELYINGRPAKEEATRVQ